ncbi:reverse transcriptase domain-containing protein [Tanacetum coccineum]|uniref:Reverse transcriptase domain-containing protein n=1 Tax=Tanacetum coccineum TaxID=301880 RepID=A0ABQ5IN15_9ASTR
MAEEDEEKTAFITSQGIFCYSKMPFRVKNAGAAYQRLVDKAFQKQIGRNLEVYVDDLLNPQKYAFGMREGTFLGYKVDADGLRARFLSKSAEKSLPFFKTLKKCTKKSDFQWTVEVETAFKQMKQSIAELPMLAAPTEKEELIMYLAAAKEAISAVLMTERGGKQIPIYFVSRALQGPEINYTPMEKLILALLLYNLEVAGRLLKWRFELEEYDIQYRPRTSVKGQILADFIVERPEDDASDTPIEEKEELPDPWVLFTDGFKATNNEAEYEALIAGLRISRQMGVQNLQANVDSKLVANQVNGVYVAKESSMIKYLEKICPPKLLVEELKEKSTDEQEILAVVEEEGHTWMTPVHEYLTEGILPVEKKKARAIRRKAGRYAVINETLYKKSFLGPWLRCVGPLQANYVLREIHEGSCSMHSGPRSVVAKALRLGYYWPTMHMDARNLIRECSDCQGIDIAVPFPEGHGKVKFLIVAVDYFTKWIEAKPVATITGAQFKKFVWDNVVCRFGLLGKIVSDNGKQFRDNPFKD